MITLERFGPQRETVRRALEAVGDRLSLALGKRAVLTLEAAADPPTLDRMLELEKEVFSIENNVYSAQDILSSLAEEDSLLLLLRIDGRIEGYVFGYDDEKENPIVHGADYFLDSALVAKAYEQKGVGAVTSGLVLLILYLLGYREIGITTEVKDRTGRELVKFYKKLGFVDAVTREGDSYGMKISLNEELVRRVRASLGVAAEAARGSREPRAVNEDSAKEE